MSAPIERVDPPDRTQATPPISPVGSVGTGITAESVDLLRYQLEKMLEGRLELDDKARREIPTFLRDFSKKMFDQKRKDLLLKAADSLEKGNILDSINYLQEFATLFKI